MQTGQPILTRRVDGSVPATGCVTDRSLYALCDSVVYGCDPRRDIQVVSGMHTARNLALSGEFERSVLGAVLLA